MNSEQLPDFRKTNETALNSVLVPNDPPFNEGEECDDLLIEGLYCLV
jgi:hypothetical protein